MLENLRVWSPAAVTAYIVGAVVALMNANNVILNAETTVPALTGLVASMMTYVVVYYALGGRRIPG
jgi:hypothetical protein